MADLRITELPALAGADISSTDPLAVADLSASETKKVTVGDLIAEGVSRFVADGAIPGAKIAADGITATQIAAAAIGESELGALSVSTAALQDASITAAKLATGAVTSAALAVNAVDASALADNAVDTAAVQDAAVTTAKLATGAVTAAVIASGAVDATALATGAVETAAIADSAVTEAKLATGAVTTAKLGALAVSTATITDGAVTAAKLGAGAVGTIALADAAVTGAKIANATITEANLNLGLGSISGGVITANSLDGSAISTGTITDAQLAAASVTTAKLATSAVTAVNVANGAIQTAAIADGAVTNAKVADFSLAYSKLNISDNEIPATKITANSITGLQIASGAIGASELATSAVGTAAIADGAVTDAKIAAGISGAKLSDASLPGTALIADTITGDKISPTAVDRGLDLVGDTIGHTNVITPGTANGITFDEQGHITATSAIAAADLPSATVGAKGAVSIPVESGLTVSGAGAVAHADTIVAGTANGITFNSTGHITSTAPLSGSDLPVATTTTVGGVSVAGPALSVDGTGALSHVASTITPGTYTKLTIDARGHATAGTAIQATDLPELDASKITTGTFGTSLIADDAITGGKLANYSTAQFGEILPAADFIGQFFFNPLDKNIYLWDGNVWQPVGVSIGELVFAGTYNASTNEVASTTTTGAAVGLTVGDPLPVASSTLSSYYVVVSIGGTGVAPAPAETLAPPDIILCDGTAWTQIDVSSTYVSQTATNVGFTPTGTIGSTNVQDAVEEVAAEAANAANLSSGVVAVARGGTGLSSYTKGNIIAATGTTSLAGLAVGSNGQVLAADSSTATGLAWVDATPGTVTSVTGTGAITVVNSTTTPSISVATASTSVAGVVQLSDSINTTSSTLAATSTAVKAAYDLANAALPKSGGTVAGNINLDTGVVLVFEGATANDFELTLASADVTADRTITLPDVSGTVITTGDTATVTNTMLAGSIADSKLNIISTANKVAASAIDIDGATDIGAALNDADLFVVDDGGAGTNRKAAATRITDYAFGKVSGDITIASNGAAAIGSGVIVNGDISASAAIAYSKLANVSATDKLLGRSSAGAGTIEEIACTAAGRALLDDADAAAQRTTLGLGTLATSSNVNTALTDPVITGTILEDVYTITDGAAFEVDPGNGSVQLITLGANRTPKATNFAAGESLTLMVNDGTAYTLTWTDTTWGGSGVAWTGGSAPTLATSGYTVLQFWKVGTQVYGAYVGDVA